MKSLESLRLLLTGIVKSEKFQKIVVKQGKALAVAIGSGLVYKLKDIHICKGEWHCHTGYEYDADKERKRLIDWKTRNCSVCHKPKSVKVWKGKWEPYQPMEINDDINKTDKEIPNRED